MDPSSHPSSTAPGSGKNSPYTFGDSDLAGHRLALLAQLYEHPSRAFLRRCAGGSSDPGRGSPPMDLALDLGCGPGHTTRLIHSVVAATRTVGIDSSEAHLDRARAGSQTSQGASAVGVGGGRGISYCRHDLRAAPLPFSLRADLVFARFILTHLEEPGRIVRLWTELLSGCGVILLQETTRMECPHPTFIRYYQLVGELQRLHGQALYIGRELETLVRAAGLTAFHSEEARFERTAADMARLHLMNLRSWREDEEARRAFDSEELDQLAISLRQIAGGTVKCPPVFVGLAEVAARRDPAGP